VETGKNSRKKKENLGRIGGFNTDRNDREAVVARWKK
jgi:hypothetical protein